MSKAVLSSTLFWSAQLARQLIFLNRIKSLKVYTDIKSIHNLQLMILAMVSPEPHHLDIPVSPILGQIGPWQDDHLVRNLHLVVQIVGRHHDLLGMGKLRKMYERVLDGGQVSAYKELLAGTVPANKELLAGTAPANNFILYI